MHKCLQEIKCIRNSLRDIKGTLGNPQGAKGFFFTQGSEEGPIWRSPVLQHILDGVCERCQHLALGIIPNDGEERKMRCSECIDDLSMNASLSSNAEEFTLNFGHFQTNIT